MANQFLISATPPQGAEGPHVNNCLCAVCRSSRVGDILMLPNITVDNLITMFFQNLKTTKSQMLDAMFLHTMEEITVGYAVKRPSLYGSGYVSFGVVVVQLVR